MSINDLRLFQSIKGNMDWLSANQQVVSGNIANANTPEYTANELKELDFAKVLRHHNRAAQETVTTATTHPGHMALGGSGLSHRTHEDRYPFEISKTGNAVTLEEQMLKLSENADQYRLSTQLYQKYAGMFRMVLRPGA